MRRVFVDTTGFYAFLDRDDPYHPEARRLFLKSEREGWHLFTSSYVVHETWALIQARLGWEAVEDWLGALLSRCEVVWVDERLHATGAARARGARQRRLSLTDCVSFEAMLARGCREAIAADAHFEEMGLRAPVGE